MNASTSTLHADDESADQRTRRRSRAGCLAHDRVSAAFAAYRRNHAAARRNENDRATCIVMLNAALGILLDVPLRQSNARSGSRRQMTVAALTSHKMRDSMRILHRRGQASRAIEVAFVDGQGRTAGLRRPMAMRSSVRSAVLAGSPNGCWSAHGLSLFNGYHTVLLLVDRTRRRPAIYWLDQHTSRPLDVTNALDRRAFDETARYWRQMSVAKGKRWATTLRIWHLAPRRVTFRAEDERPSFADHLHAEKPCCAPCEELHDDIPRADQDGGQHGVEADEELLLGLRTVLGTSADGRTDGDLSALLDVVRSELSAADGLSLEKGLRSIGQAAKKVASDPNLRRAAATGLPIAGGAVGTMIGGPVGTAVGTTLGAQAAKAIAPPTKSEPHTYPAGRRRLSKATRPPEKLAPQGSLEPGGSVPASVQRRAQRTAQLAQSPQVLSLLLKVALGGAIDEAHATEDRGALADLAAAISVLLADRETKITNQDKETHHV